MEIYDLHCDLLCYLAHDPSRTPEDPEVRCSLPQLKEGGVAFQVLPIFTPTQAGSAARGMAQWDTYQSLDTKGIKVALAVENASSFCEEDEPLEQGLKRFDQLGPLTYLSLTWNGENRFGGGAGSSTGLKPDGKTVLRHLHGKGIAIDFSHTSDPLGYEIFDFIDKEALEIPVLASHSNFRAVHDVVRNLPDPLALEIFKRGGVIGLNFVKMFIGPTPEYFIKQVEHALQLGGTDGLCLGADFFYGFDIPAEQRKSPDVYWFDEYQNASSYPRFFELLRPHFNEAFLTKLARLNFCDKLIEISV